MAKHTRKPEDADVGKLRRAQEKRFSPRVNRVDQKFHELRVLRLDEARSAKEHTAFWVCACSCGRIITARGSRLVSGYTKSCGHTRPGGVPSAAKDARDAIEQCIAIVRRCGTAVEAITEMRNLQAQCHTVKIGPRRKGEQP